MIEPDRGGSSTKEADTVIAMAPLAVTFTEDEIDDIDGDLRRPLQQPRRNSPAGTRPRVTPTQPRNRTSSQGPAENIPLINNRNGGSRDGQLANTEIIDVDIDDRETFTPGSHPGVDDGFFPENGVDGLDGPGGKREPPSPGAPFPSSPFDPIDPNMPDINVYQHKKTLAQGLMDLALVSANANQLRYVLESSKRHPYYHFSLGLIITSLVIQVVVGVGLILNSRYNIKCDAQMKQANRVNNITMVLIFLLTFVNVFITAFGVAEYQPSTVVAPTT